MKKNIPVQKSFLSVIFKFHQMAEKAALQLRSSVKKGTFFRVVLTSSCCNCSRIDRFSEGFPKWPELIILGSADAGKHKSSRAILIWTNAERKQVAVTHTSKRKSMALQN